MSRNFTFKAHVEFYVCADTIEEARDILQRDLRELDKTGEWTGDAGSEICIIPKFADLMIGKEE